MKWFALFFFTALNAQAGYNVTMFESHLHGKRLFKLVIKNTHGPLSVISTHREVHISEEATVLIENNLLAAIEQWVLQQERERGRLVAGNASDKSILGRENIKRGRSSVIALMEGPDLSTLQFVLRADRRGVAKMVLGVEESEELVILPPSGTGDQQRYMEGTIQLMNFAKAGMAPPEVVTLGLLEAEASELLTRGRDITGPGYPRRPDFWILMGYMGEGVVDWIPPSEYIVKCHKDLIPVYRRRGFALLPRERFVYMREGLGKEGYGLKNPDDVLMFADRQTMVRTLQGLNEGKVGQERQVVAEPYVSTARRHHMDSIVCPDATHRNTASILDAGANTCRALIARQCPLLEFISLEKYYGGLMTHFWNGGNGLIPSAEAAKLGPWQIPDGRQ